MAHDEKQRVRRESERTRVSPSDGRDFSQKEMLFKIAVLRSVPFCQVGLLDRQKWVRPVAPIKSSRL